MKHMKKLKGIKLPELHDLLAWAKRFGGAWHGEKYLSFSHNEVRRGGWIATNNNKE